MADNKPLRRRGKTGAQQPADEEEAFDDDVPVMPTLTGNEGELIPVWVIYISIVLGVCILIVTIFYASTMEFNVEGYLILYNSTIHSVDKRMPLGNVLVVKDGRFVDLAPAEELEALSSRHFGARRINLHGNTVLPGFTDAHMHIHHLGSFFLNVQLTGAKSLADIRQRIREYIESPPKAFDPARHWIVGMGWDQTVIPELEGEFPTKDHLDSDPVLRKLPILLYRIDFHACWLNGRALEAVSNQHMEFFKVNGTTLAGGDIVRFPDGRPSGILIDNTMKFAEAVKPKFGLEWDLEAIDAAVGSMLKVGVTGAHDAAMSTHLLDVFKKAVDQNRMPLRVYGMLHCENASRYCGDEVGKVDGYGGNRLTVKSVKLFLDGAVGSWGAYLWEPYADKPNDSGILRADAAGLPDLVWEWVKNGWQVNSHAIGDKANSLVIDAYEKAIRKWASLGGYTANLRLRIEHAQFIRPGDIPRIAELKVIPSMQPTHCTSDMWYVEKRLGKERARDTGYRWKSLLKAGVPVLALGSDAPVETVDPFAGFYAAITRKDAAGKSPHGSVGWNEDEVLTRQEALEGFTIAPAYASFQEEILGSITPGKLADFIVIDKDIMSVPEQEILETKVLATVIGGKVVYSRDGLLLPPKLP